MGYAIFVSPVESSYRQLLLPCIGAAAFLFAQPNPRDPVFKIMGSSVFRTVGQMSYSIYLWHWPIFVFAKIYIGVLDNAATGACILLTLLLSAVTLYAVENPIRFKRAPRGRPLLFAMATASTLALAIFAGAGLYTSGLPSRLPPRVATLYTASSADRDMVQCLHLPGGQEASVAMAETDKLCILGDNTRQNIDFILWGDSHALWLSTALSDFAKEAGLKGLVAMIPGCPTLANTVSSDLGRKQKCNEFYDRVAQNIERHNIRQIFIVNRWSLYSEGAGGEGYLKFANDWDNRTNPHDVFRASLDRTISQFSDKHIAFIKEPPLQRVHVTDTMAAIAMTGMPFGRLENIWTTRQQHDNTHRFLDQTFNDAKSKFSNIAVLDPLPFLCSVDHCTAMKDDLPLYWDDDHLNMRGVRLLKPLFAPIFRRMKETATE
jgi:hypothetical protein